MTTPTGPYAGGLGVAPGAWDPSQYGLSPSTLNATSFNFASAEANPRSPVNVGKRALGVKGNVQGPGLNEGLTNYDNAQNLPTQWYSNDKSFYNEFIAKAIMYKLPNADPDMGLPEAGAVWDSLLQTAIKLSNTTNRTWTPWDVMESYNHKPGTLGTHRVGDWIIDNATGEKVKYVGPRSKTTTQTSVDLSDPETAQALITNSLTQLLGRAPSDGELARFRSTLTGYERANPSVATTTESYDDQGNVVSSRTTRSGGVTDAGRQAVLADRIDDSPEYAKYQAGTTYFNALLGLIGGG